jgi:hypothetical protein
MPEKILQLLLTYVLGFSEIHSQNELGVVYVCSTWFDRSEGTEAEVVERGVT